MIALTITNNLVFLFIGLLAANRMSAPKIYSSKPATTKSILSQFTSLVNCIATNGISKIVITSIAKRIQFFLNNFNFNNKFSNWF